MYRHHVFAENNKRTIRQDTIWSPFVHSSLFLYVYVPHDDPRVLSPIRRLNQAPASRAQRPGAYASRLAPAWLLSQDQPGGCPARRGHRPPGSTQLDPRSERATSTTAAGAPSAVTAGNQISIDYSRYLRVPPGCPLIPPGARGRSLGGRLVSRRRRRPQAERAPPPSTSRQRRGQRASSSKRRLPRGERTAQDSRQLPITASMTTAAAAVSASNPPKPPAEVAA